MLRTRKAYVAVIAGLVGLLATSAQAQIVEVDKPDVQTLACLQTGKPALDYPSHDLQLKIPGHVRVSLTFTAPDRPPAVELLFRAASDAMVDEVRSHLRSYRLPCMKASAPPQVVVQEFEFKPRVTDPITWSTPRAVADRSKGDPGRPKTGDLSACMRTPKEQPDFVGTSFDRDVANVFVQASFSDRNTPPAVKLVYSSAGKSQSSSVLEYVSQYRLPCLPEGAKPYVMQQHFQFRPYGVGARTFKDAVSLPSFLSNIKGIRTKQASFDFSTMNCPFQVAWRLGKPALDNHVGEVGPRDLNRTELLAWLESLEMDLKERPFEQLVGQTLIININCGRLDLAPTPAAAS